MNPGMEGPKEIIVFSDGSPRDASTWSNVPYLLVTTFEKRGVKIHTYSYKHAKWIRAIARGLWLLSLKFYPGNVYTFNRTKFSHFLISRKIKRAVAAHPNADYCLFTTFSLYNKYGNIPTIQFCDWTYDILLNERLGRTPYSFEKRFLKLERESIEHAKYAFCMFPECAKSIQKVYPTANCIYLNQNVVNTLYNKKFDINDAIKIKARSNIILFIGNFKYTSTAKLLVEVIKKLRLKYPHLELHLIGQDENVIGKHDGVFCHGYLHKDIPEEKDLYYKLLIGAKVFVNPTPTWAGYSSTIEAMYYGTPILISKYKDFEFDFGEKIAFGVYNESFDEKCIMANIDNIISNKDYENMCVNAHDAVKDYTWDNMVDKILNIIKKQ